MSCTSGGGKSVVPEQFPSGLRVLVVDDDLVCLRVLEQMLHKCMYKVTSCSQAKVALNLLRERKGGFDIVLSDVHMPDMDGFKLLELVGLEMDLPVIMMSADGRTNLVMRGIRHGACDYLIKPIRDEAVKNIWQHVVRKRWKESKENDTSDNDLEKRAIADAEYDASSVNEGADGVLKSRKKRRDTKDEDDKELENDDPTMAKKPRVVWSLELHQQFVSAVNQVGIDKAVPKRILELMNVPGLTRENVASHLQKFRLYLKRLSVVAQLQGGLPANSYCGQVQQIQQQQASLGRFDIQALAASGHLPPQTLTAALQAEILSRPEGNLRLPAMDQSSLLYASLPVDRNVAYGQPQIKCSSNIMSNEDIHSATFGMWTSKNPSDMSTLENVVETDTSMLISRMPNVQPSCVVLPSQQSSPSFQGSYNPRVLDQGQISNDVYIGNGPSIPSRFAVDEEEELQMSNINRSNFFAENNGNKVKQEPTMGSLKVGPHHFSSKDLMSVFSD